MCRGFDGDRGLDGGHALAGPFQGPSERLAVDRLGLRQRTLAELAGQDPWSRRYWRTTCEREPVSPWTDDEDRVGLLAQGIAGEQPLGGRVARRAGRRPRRRRWATIDQRVLVAIGEPLALGGEAFVAEPSTRSPRYSSTARLGAACAVVEACARTRSRRARGRPPSGSRPCPSRRRAPRRARRRRRSARGGPARGPAAATRRTCRRRPARGPPRWPRATAAGGRGPAGRRAPGRAGRRAGCGRRRRFATSSRPSRSTRRSRCACSSRHADRHRPAQSSVLATSGPDPPWAGRGRAATAPRR